MEKHLITREIGVDMGHRVTHHGSKCRNLHGHRYTIQATCEGPLFKEGEQQGMVLDFGFLKEEMMNEIDEPCDHGMCLWSQDSWANVLVFDYMTKEQEKEALAKIICHDYVSIQINDKGDNTGGKYYIVPFVPTAENLAKHWFERLAPRVKERTDNQSTLKKIKVWETPNCSAEYHAVSKVI